MGVILMEIDWLQLISTQGVAVVLAIYLVWWITDRLSKKLDNLTDAINNLTKAVNTLKVIVDRGREHDGGE